MKFGSVAAIPVSARYGDNVTRRSARTDWYGRPSLLEHLEGVTIDADQGSEPFRLPVQWVNRPTADFRGYAGTLASGRLRAGDEIVIGRSGVRTRVARIATMDGDLDEAAAGDAVTVVLADEIDVSRGDVFATPDNPPQRADAFAAPSDLDVGGAAAAGPQLPPEMRRPDRGRHRNRA